MSRGPAWTARELALLRLHAPTGTRGVRKHLPHRSRSSIRHKAKVLGIDVPCSPSGDVDGKRHRGKLPIPQHCHPFVRKVFEEANAQRSTLAEIAKRSGVNRERFSDWKRRSEPRISELVAVLNTLDLDLVIVPKGIDA